MSSIRRRAWSALIVLLSAFVASAATDSEIGLAGKVVDASGAAVGGAVVSLRQGEALPRLRGLSAADGSFRLGLADPSSRAGRAIRATTLEDALAGSGPLTLSVQDLGGRGILGLRIDGTVSERRARLQRGLASLRPGLLIATLSDAGGRRLHVGKVLLDGRGGWTSGPAAEQPGAARAAAGDTVVVRKAGYLSARVALASLRADLGAVVLRIDPLESSIDSVLRLMTLDDKVGQMLQSNLGGSTPADARTSRLGSVLSGGNEALPVFSDWQNQALSTPRAIPLIYGIDAVHGNSKASGATIFPHNIGLGATRDADLVRRMGEVVAKEVVARDMDFAFGPCVAVARDERWGRTYESFGEAPELAASLGAALVRGLQGDRFDAPWRVAASAKHFLADGGAEWGTGEHDIDQGDARISDSTMRAIHLPGYVASVEAGVATVMASYSSINGQKMHGNKALLTDLLKTELGFDGFIISDWAAIAQLGGTGEQQVARSVNAGVDMLMEPGSWKTRIAELKACVGSGTISQQRIDDAVRRILRIKYRMGRMSQPMPPSTWDADFGSAPHRAVAREAVRKSLVLLKNDAAVLPLSKSGRKIAVVGTHADNTGLQCGGWTKVGGNDGTAWQGAPGIVQGATSILAGMRAAFPGVQTAASGADVVVVVTGEEPYAEMQGDRADLALPAAAATQLASAKAAGQKTVLVVVSGRPLILGGAVQNADAIVAAWLPGSEGAGVADVLFGDHAPTGKLSFTWPARMDQVPVNVGDADYASNPPLYPFGHGLSW